MKFSLHIFFLYFLDTVTVTPWYLNPCFEVCRNDTLLQSVDFVQVFQSVIVLWLPLVALRLVSEDCCTHLCD